MKAKTRNLLRLAPLQLLILGTAGFAFCIAYIIYLASNTPVLGLEFEATSDGLVITDIGRHAPLLKTSDVIKAISAVEGNIIPVNNFSVIREPDNLPSYSQFNAFMRHQDELFKILQSPLVTVYLDDNSAVELKPIARHVTRLPISFWYMLTCAILVWLIVIGIWCFRQRDPATTSLLIGGLGYAMLILSLAVYSNRELAISIDQFQMLSYINHIGTLIYGFFSALVLWYSPTRISRWPMAYIITSLIAIFALIRIMQWPSLPLHTFHFQNLMPPILIAIFGFIQWRLSRHRPAQRASIKWFVLSFVLCAGCILGLYLIPLIHGSNSLASLEVMSMVVIIVFIGLAFGILRYRIFNLERWWFEVWMWFLAGICLVAIDAAIIYAINAAPLVALSLAIFIAAWIYFPVRQMLWAKFVQVPGTRYDQYLPDLVRFYSTIATTTITASWSDLLQKLFRPLRIELIERQQNSCALQEDGLKLVVPNLEPDSSLVLTGYNSGSRLFSPEQLTFTDNILTMAKQALAQKEAEQRGANAERDRIMRDLHDDVGAKLLTLVYQAKDEPQRTLASTALKTLKDIVYCLNRESRLALEDAIADWRYELVDRIQDSGLRYDWHCEAELEPMMLTPRESINLARILREAISNIIKHTDSDYLRVKIALDDAMLNIRIFNSVSNTAKIEDWIPGMGMTNMKQRAEAIGAQLTWQHCEKPRGFEVIVVLAMQET